MRKHSLDTMNLIGIIAHHRNYPEIRKAHNLLHLRVPPFVTSQGIQDNTSSQVLVSTTLFRTRTAKPKQRLLAGGCKQQAKYRIFCLPAEVFG